MKAVTLADLIAPAQLRRAGGADLPVLSMTMHAGLVDQSAKFRKRIASADTSEYKVVKSGQLVVGFPIDEGVLDFQSLYPEGIVSPAYGIWDLKDSRTTDRDYLSRFLRSPRAIAYYKGKLRGSTARRRSLPTAVFLALEVPLPEINEQRRIAAMLDHADDLRAKRLKSLRLLDVLGMSVFSDMFGDPEDTARPSVKFEEVAELQGGRNLVGTEETIPAAFRVLKISAVTTGQFKPYENKPLPIGYVPPPSHFVQEGDLLISRANTTELVGAVAYVERTPPNLALPDKIWRFVWRDSASVPLYYWALFRTPSVRRRVKRLSSGTGGSMKNISKAKLEQLELPLVEVEAQGEFARRLAAIPRPRIGEFDELLISLQSRAFSGQL